ncbi:MAG: hypothetical protein QM669_14535 [Siphonobacter sp.]
MMKRVSLIVLALLGSLMSVSALDRDSVIVTLGNKSRIIIYGENREELKKLLNYDVNRLLRDVNGKIDSTSQVGTTRIILGEMDGDAYKKGNTGTIYSNKDSIRVDIQGDTATSKPQRIRKIRTWWQNDQDNFVLSIGLNAYAKNQPLGYNVNDYELKPLGSRYFSLGFYRNPALIKGQKVALRVKLGFDFSWYNLMFQNKTIATKEASEIAFLESQTPLRKSKLTAAYFNVPVVPTVAFRRGIVSHIGVGGYAGYRLDSYTKTKTYEGKKDHNHAGYWLNNFRYGLMAELGFRNSVDLFVQYDLNELYQSNRGPQIQMVSFGIRLN